MMFNSTSASHAFQAPTRCITSLKAPPSNSDDDYDSDETHAFLVGTCSLKNSTSNSLHLITVNTSVGLSENEVQHRATLPHNAGEVCAMESNPADGSLIVTCGGSISGGNGYECKTRLYKLPDDVLSFSSTSSSQREQTQNGLYEFEHETSSMTTGTTDYNNSTARKQQQRQRMVTPTPDDDANSAAQQLETLLTLQHDTPSRLSAILWKPIVDAYSDYTTTTSSSSLSSLSNEVCTVGPEGLRIFDATGHGDGVCTTHVTIMDDVVGGTCRATSSGVVAGSWDSHNVNLIGVSYGRDVGIWDVRCGSSSSSSSTTPGAASAPQQKICNAHRHGICDLDHNPNRPYILCTGGEDGLIKFWDLRKIGGGATTEQQQQPIKILSGHTHWANTVKYNRFHDQLVLSGSTDSTVNLWRVSSISSAPYMELEEEEGFISDANLAYGSSASDFHAAVSGVGGDIVDHNRDMRINRFEHQESVYGVAWSACDAWLFASLSYDGNVVVNCVPSKEKYKILL